MQCVTVGDDHYRMAQFELIWTIEEATKSVSVHSANESIFSKKLHLDVQKCIFEHFKKMK
jgi:hypothetical protein